MILPLGKTRSRLAFDVPNARAKRRGGKASPRSQNVTPRPLERRVGLPDGETTPGTEGFGSSPLLSGATQRDAPDLLGLRVTSLIRLGSVLVHVTNHTECLLLKKLHLEH